MSMTPLEATVEIVKAALSGSGGASTVSNAYLISDDKHRENIAQTIDKIYKKIYQLEYGKEYGAK